MEASMLEGWAADFPERLLANIGGPNPRVARLYDQVSCFNELSLFDGVPRGTSDALVIEIE